MTEENNAPVAEPSEGGSSFGNALPPSIESSSESSEPSHSSEIHSSENGRDAKPAGYDPVDVHKATPEQIQERLDYLYRQVKPKERENREMRQLLEQQSRIIEDLSKGQQAVVNHLTTRSFAESEDQLKREMQDAWEKRDNRAYIEAQNKLLDVQVQKRLNEKQTSPQTQQQQPQYRNAAEIANAAVQSGEINGDEYRATEAWQNERDGNGNFVRPWAYSNHPDYQAALFESRSVMANPRFQNLSYEQKLAEVDRRMGVQKKPSGQQVMGGSLTQAKKSTKIELSPKQREIALKTKYAGKDKSEADHLEAYRKQIEKYSQRRA